ncbi:putative hAMP domain protein [Synechococcus sp. BIOS-E4-1]|uniref:signal protein n=1 Tax=Synechococcus sp. BIOS-E4-1 TaxID=1400864 RepID=UPI0016463B2A|nr:signal protein [Synechococcus sp. BIOS-E4-1]QNI55440.1 putative hAMP domain protein [Synechococcus sp. BIOS-E4-1]
MRDRLWIVIPAAGFPFLLVLFIVLWQSLQQQNRTIQNLVKQLDGLEGVELRNREGNQALIEQQLEVLQTRQQKLQRQISNLESWQRASGDRERTLWNRLETPFPPTLGPDLTDERDIERTTPPELPSSPQLSSPRPSSQQPSSRQPSSQQPSSQQPVISP